MNRNLEHITDRIHTGACKKMGIEHGTLMELVFLGLAFNGEAGELSNVIKKMWRDGDSPELWEKARKEAADCIIYMSHILKAMGVTEDAVVEEKLTELRDRWPEFFQTGVVPQPEGVDPYLQTR